jgi:hypothetical protein
MAHHLTDIAFKGAKWSLLVRGQLWRWDTPHFLHCRDSWWVPQAHWHWHQLTVVWSIIPNQSLEDWDFKHCKSSLSMGVYNTLENRSCAWFLSVISWKTSIEDLRKLEHTFFFDNQESWRKTMNQMHWQAIPALSFQTWLQILVSLLRSSANIKALWRSDQTWNTWVS